uniref:Uncharacterized protein n=1 Tax=Panagrolaimus sp. ES5 TaxID=591445 RepID=A0AC34F674_9BILA
MSLPNIDHIVVIRQKERKKSKQKHQEIRHFGPEKSKKNSCPASVYAIDHVQKQSIASIRSYRINRRLSDTMAISQKCSLSDLRNIELIEAKTIDADSIEDEKSHEAVRSILGESKDEELACILPHVQMIGTLMSIVANIEEQKRLARQSQVFLSMTQNVFSSLRIN